MPAEDIDKLLAEQKAIEERKQKLIEELMKQKAAAVKEFDDKLAKLGYMPNGKAKRSHHRKPAAPAGDKAKA